MVAGWSLIRREKCKSASTFDPVYPSDRLQKRGRKIFGTAWKRDPLGPAFHTNFVWGQRFLQILAALPDEHQPGAARAIPIDFIHAPSPARPRKKDPSEVWAEYRRQQEESKASTLASNHLRQLRQEVAEKTIICPIYGGFINQTVFRNPPDDAILIGSIRKDARLFLPPVRETEPGRGRKPFYGKPLPTPEEIRKDDFSVLINTCPWKKFCNRICGDGNTAVQNKSEPPCRVT